MSKPFLMQHNKEDLETHMQIEIEILETRETPAILWTLR